MSTLSAKRTQAPHQPNLFDDSFGERVAAFAKQRGMRSLKPYEIETLSELGESLCANVLPTAKRIESVHGHIEQYLEATKK
jgi:hypothetical protein